jgi:hypothetical protein
MHTKRFYVAAICFFALIAINCSAATQPQSVSHSQGITLKLAGGPEPVPICPPEKPTCDTLPSPNARPISVAMHLGLIGGPEPVPICPPEKPTCDTLPSPNVRKL